MNFKNTNSPNYYNLNRIGASGPQATYPQVYDKVDNIPGQEVNSLLDFSIIRDIREIYKNNVAKKSSGNDSANVFSNSWTNLNNHPAKKTSIFNDSNEVLEIKQIKYPVLTNYNHSTTFSGDLTAGTGLATNTNHQGWGDFRTVFNNNFKLTNSPVLARNTFSYSELPQDFETKEWQISFDIETAAPGDWINWDPNWTLGNGYAINIFNSWDNYPSPIGVLPGSLGNGNFPSVSNFVSNPDIGEDGVKGYTLFISDPRLRSSKIANDLFPDFAITGAYISGEGLATGDNYNLMLSTSGLNANPLNERVRLLFQVGAYGMQITGLSKEDSQVLRLPKTVAGRDILSFPEQYAELLLEVERAYPDGNGGTTKMYIRREWARLNKNGGLTSWSNFSPRSRPNETTYSNYIAPDKTINEHPSAKSRTITLFYADTVLASTVVDLANYFDYDQSTKVIFAQKGGRLGVYLQNKFNGYDLVLNHYDRHYYARAKIGRFFGVGSLIRHGQYAYHYASNIILNDQRIDLASQASIANSINLLPTSIKLYPNTALDMQISNTNQIFIYRTGQSSQSIQYRWEN